MDQRTALKLKSFHQRLQLKINFRAGSGESFIKSMGTEQNTFFKEKQKDGKRHIIEETEYHFRFSNHARTQEEKARKTWSPVQL